MNFDLYFDRGRHITAVQVSRNLAVLNLIGIIVGSAGHVVVQGGAVADLVGKVNFDLYFDRGGWLMTFVKSNRL